jgi:hypothetical protein
MSRISAELDGETNNLPPGRRAAWLELIQTPPRRERLGGRAQALQRAPF